MARSQGWIWLAVGSMLVSACSSAPKPAGAPVAANTPVTSALDAREPAEITKVGEGDYRVEWCGNSSDSGRKYELLVNGSGDNAGGRLDANGCLKFTFRDNRVRPGDNIVYRIDGQNRASETVPGRQTGNPPPRPNEPSPSQPTLQRVDLNKVENEAENRARCTANAVVGLYGRVESYRYNFSRGFRSGLQLYNLTNLGDLRRSPEYQQGYSIGDRDGAVQGMRAGERAGESDAASRASSDVHGRYVAIVDRNMPPDLTRTVPNPGFEGLRADIAEPRGVGLRISDLEAEYRAHVMRQSFGYEGDVMRWDSWRQEWTLGYYYQHDFSNELVRGWYRDDWAFDMYRRRQFSRCADGVDYYNKIRDGNLYSNAAQAESTYRQMFKREYDRVIDSKWNNAVRAENPAAFHDGQGYGYRVAREYARDVGYTTGYRLSYSEQSRVSYDGRFAQAYVAVFDREVQRYEQGTIPQLQEAQVVTDGGNGRVNLVVGMPLTVNLLKAYNLGRQPGDVAVTVAGPHVMNASKKTVRFEPSATVKEEGRLVGPLGYVSTAVAPNGTAEVVIEVGGNRMVDRFVMDWKNLVRVAGSTQGQIQSTQLEYLFAIMSKEMKDHDGGFFEGNPWESPKEDRLLKQAAYVIEKMSPQEKASFKSVVSRLRTAMGKRPSGVFGGCNKKCQAWNSLDGWLKKME